MGMIKKMFWAAAVFVLGILAGYEAAGPLAVRDFSVFYSLERKQNDQEIVRLIDAADKYAYFGIYAFTKKDIADALIRAHGRGLDVRGIMDAGQSRDGAQADIAARLARAGIPIEFQRHAAGIMHIKLLVTDRSYALGSYNWTESATMVNDEVLEIGNAEPLREKYLSLITRVLAANR